MTCATEQKAGKTCQQGSHVRRAVVGGSEKRVPYGKDGRPMPLRCYYKDFPSKLLNLREKWGEQRR